jgi:(p)ppGpp synthase/HD superfamily hydrolase
MVQMDLTEQQWNLFDFVKEQHQDQLRKYTGEPYFVHLLRVAEILSQYSIENMELEIALCHDLLERTSCSKQELVNKFKELGYDLFSRSGIAKGVYDLTNLYSEQNYPNQSRTERKRLEADRLLDIEPFSQTVMYAELIDNIPAITKFDPDFAWIYLEF